MIASFPRTLYNGIRNMSTPRRKDVLLAITPPSPWRGNGVRHYAREAGWNLIDLSRLVSGLGDLAGWRGDGAIVTLRDNPDTPAFVRRMRRAGVPFVDLSSQSTDIRIPHVCLDNVAIGRVAATHFAAFNHRRAAWFSTYWMNAQAQRFAGFTEGWEAVPGSAGPPERWVLHEGVPPERWNDARAVSRWLDARLRAAPRPLALFCYCVEDASRILTECAACGIRVPQDIAVLATDDDQAMCEMQPVPLSCIQQNGERQGYEAAALLDRLMDGERPPRRPVLIPPDGIAVRASTDWTAAADPLVAQALMLVADNLSHPWGVAQLSRELGVPPLRLGRHFHVELGRSPGEEILRQRLARAQTLLRETDLPLGKIAEQCGFCHAAYLSNLFHRETGLSPRAFRQGQEPHASARPDVDSATLFSDKSLTSNQHGARR